MIISYLLELSFCFDYASAYGWPVHTRPSHVQPWCWQEAEQRFRIPVHGALPFRLRDGLLDDSVGEVDLGGFGVGEARLEGVAQGHEFVDLGDDAVLFGKRWERHKK